MSHKFFSLIHGEKIHLSPETKFIKQNELATLMNSNEILKRVKEDAKQFKMELTEEIEKERAEAVKKGFEEGFKTFAETLAHLETMIHEVREDMENVIVPVALKAAKKILGRELETSQTAVVAIVKAALKGVAQHKKITLWVNKSDWEILEKNKEELKKQFENLEAFAIRPREDITPAGAVIETEAGIINAQLENQWLILEAAFEKLMLSQKEQEV